MEVFKDAVIPIVVGGVLCCHYRYKILNYIHNLSLAIVSVYSKYEIKNEVVSGFEIVNVYMYLSDSLNEQSVNGNDLSIKQTIVNQFDQLVDNQDTLTKINIPKYDYDEDEEIEIEYKLNGKMFNVIYNLKELVELDCFTVEFPMYPADTEFNEDLFVMSAEFINSSETPNASHIVDNDILHRYAGPNSDFYSTIKGVKINKQYLRNDPEIGLDEPLVLNFMHNFKSKQIEITNFINLCELEYDNVSEVNISEDNVSEDNVSKVDEEYTVELLNTD